MTAPFLLGAFSLGAALGAAHFLSLWWSVALMRGNRAGLGVALQGLRFATLAAALVLLALRDASLLPPAAAGVVVARLVLTRLTRRADG